MRVNTRFNPTVNGLLHVGHLLHIMVNAYEAQSTGGRFVVRFDDNQAYWNNLLGVDQVDIYREKMKRDIEVFVKVDEFSSQVIDYTYVVDILRDTTPELARLKLPSDKYYHVPEWPADPGETYFPYAPLFTAEKVWIDHDEGTNWLIRGEDLLTEFGIYEYFVELFEYREMRHTYLPRVMIYDGHKFIHIAKSQGDKYSIQNMLDHYAPRNILEKLRKGCLKDPEGQWTADNVALEPRFFYED